MEVPSRRSKSQIILRQRRRGVEERTTQAESAGAAAVQASVDKAVAELGGFDVLSNYAAILRSGELKDSSLAGMSRYRTSRMR